MSRRDAVRFTGTQRFSVVRQIGAGGMGTVYEVIDKDHDARLALKSLRSLEAEAILRFKHEFHALSDLHHPNLVRLEELFSVDGSWFFTMEYVRGVDFLAWVRGRSSDNPRSSSPSPSEDTLSAPGQGPPVPEGVPAKFDEPALRRALLQLARGLFALHAADKVHRDIKPSNVLVTNEGRVVLIDLGLVADMKPGHDETEVHLVGTAAYMAPEQAAAKEAGPPADWYAFGVLLFQALTGQLPFVGAQLQVLMDKQRLEAPEPRSIVADVPEDLNLLCADLLRFDPAQRPSGRAVLRRLGAREQSIRIEALSTGTWAPPFVGRTRELQELRAAFDRTRSGAAVTVLIEGESGVGKSSLTKRFADGLKASSPPAVVLSGRCYERESLPYKAFDGIVDSLSRWMRKLPKSEAAALLPRRAALLSQAFPVLGRVEVLAQAPRPPEEGLDPLILRGRVFTALRELLALVGERHPLVLTLDDLQWADQDSLVLLDELLRASEPPALLLIATLRAGLSGPVAKALAALPGDVRRLSIERLPPDQAEELATRLLENAAADPSVAAALAQEGGGHPLFIDELVRHSAIAAGGGERGVLRLDDALWARACRLDAPARQLLELICVSGAPLVQEVARDAVEMSPAEFSRHASVLTVAHLARTSGELIEPYHNRVREAVLAHLDAQARRERHWRLAVTLEARGGMDPEQMMQHFSEAGVRDKAGQYAAAAAAQAADALAFDHAARLYRHSLELQPATGSEGAQRKTLYADALANAGMGHEAASVYLDAAEASTAAEGLELKRRAAQQLLRSGHIEEGLKGLGQVLSQLGMRMRPTHWRALLSLGVQRARIGLRGYKWKPRDASEIAARDLSRLDLLYSASTSLGMIDHIRGADFQTRHLLEALRHGEPRRVCKALAIEAVFRASEGVSPALVDRLIAEVERLAAQFHEPYLDGIKHMTRGARALFRADWRVIAEEFGKAEVFFGQSIGARWERVTSQQQIMICHATVGRFAEARQNQRFLDEARKNNDRYALAMLQQPQTWLLIADDLPVEAERSLQSSLHGWPADAGYLPQLLAAQMTALTHAYQGQEKAKQGLAQLNASLAKARRGLVMRVPLVRAQYMVYGGMLRVAAGDYRSLGRLEQLPDYLVPTIFGGVRELLRAGRAHNSNRPLETRQHLEAALAILSAIDAQMWELGARHRLGLVTGGEPGRRMMSESEATMSKMGVKNLPRMLAVLAPGFD